MTAITLGRSSPNGSVPPTRQLTLRNHKVESRGEPRHSGLAYLVLLRAEIARFTRPGCPGRLVSVALILTSRWRAVSSCAVLCSPDFPPVRPFGTCTSGGPARFTGVIISPIREQAQRTQWQTR